MNQSRILLITHIYPPAIDGGSKIISKIGDYLSSKKHHTLVLTSDCHTTDDFVVNTPKITFQPSANIIRLPVYRHLRRPLKLLKLKGPIFKVLPLFLAIIRIIRFQPNFIFAGPLPTSIILYAFLFKIITRSKLIIIPCFHPHDRDFRQAPLTFVLRRANLLCSLTDYEKKLLCRFNSNVYTMKAGIDKNFLINPDEIKFPRRPHILFLGNFAAHKGIDILLSAYTKLRRRHPKLRLTIAGQKTLFHQHLSFMDPNVTIIDHGYNTSRLKQLIDHATAIILPSRHESLGLVLVESMARGKPVIASNLPPIVELLRLTGGGLTFSLVDNCSLTSQIKRIITTPFLTKTLGLNGLESVRKYYTWDKIGEDLCKKLSSLS